MSNASSYKPARRRIQQAAMQLFAERGVTRVSVATLAQAAGVARGTVYNHLDHPESLFESVAAHLGTEMDQLIAIALADIQDPARRLADGIRYYVRRAHEEPHWGRFLSRFATSTPSLQNLWQGRPLQDVIAGLHQGRYDFRADQLPSVAAMVGSMVLSAITLVLDGHRGWREAGANAAELVLVALGVPREEARRLVEHELPPLPELAAEA